MNRIRNRIVFVLLVTFLVSSLLQGCSGAETVKSDKYTETTLKLKNNNMYKTNFLWRVESLKYLILWLDDKVCVTRFHTDLVSPLHFFLPNYKTLSTNYKLLRMAGRVWLCEIMLGIWVEQGHGNHEEMTHWRLLSALHQMLCQYAYHIQSCRNDSHSGIGAEWIPNLPFRK